METGGEPVKKFLSPRPLDEHGLSIKLLGNLSVRRGGEELALPRSRKCRALIAYLAATGRPQRREALCELFWELPDDPRGALRWSLSKIRRVLGSALVADRECVSLDQHVLSIDADCLRRAAQGLDSMATEDMEALAAEWGRPFGEDLDLPACLDFQGWLIGFREDVRQAQLVILEELVRRLESDPDRALPFARKRVACDQLDEQARLDLIKLLMAMGRVDEAERQQQIAVETLIASRVPVPAAMTRPLRAAKASAKPELSLVQRIQFCSAPDGTRIAYSVLGSGPPLIKTANWMGHLEYELDSPLLRHWLLELSRDRTLVRYDARGNGLSDRSPADFSLKAFVEDLEAVSGKLAQDKFDLLGISQGSAVAAAFAAKHPARVRKLILFGGFARGWRHSRAPEVQERWKAMITLTGLGWGTNNPAFRQLFTSLFVPQASSDKADWFNELQRRSASPEEAQQLLRAVGEFDVRDLLPAIDVPTIVFHCRGDALIPFTAGRQLAAEIPRAEFVSLESDSHVPLEDEPAWAMFVERLREFLAR